MTLLLFITFGPVLGVSLGISIGYGLGWLLSRPSSEDS
jgi:hypothetical protein